MTRLIERNTTIPTSRSQIFSTASDNQTSVEIHVLQGEREMAQDNKTLGRFILDGIPPAPRGLPQIEVSFDIDANGILNVRAIDKTTNKEQKITITASSGLSKEEIERMKNEAEAHKEEDRKKRELVEAKNIAENLVYSAEKNLRDLGDKVTEDIKKEIREKIDGVKSATQKDEISEIKNACDALSSSLSKIGEAIYQKGSSDQKSDQKNEGETIEGEYQEPEKS